MKVFYFAYIVFADGPNSHARGFISFFSKYVERLDIIGIRQASKRFWQTVPKWKRFFKRLQPDIYYDLNKLLANIGCLFKEYKELKQCKPDIIIFRYELYKLTPFLFSMLYKIPLVLEANGSAAYESNKFGTHGNQRLAGFFEKRILRHAEAVYTVSNVLKNYFIKAYDNIDPSKYYTVPNGVDVKKMTPMDKEKAKQEIGFSDTFIVGFVGSFAPWHDIDILIQSAEKLRSKRIKYLLIGAGRKKEYYMNRVTRKRLDRTVIFLDPMSHEKIHLYLSAMDMTSALSLPTYGDDFHGSPIKLFEYMAMQKVVMATKFGQFMEIIRDHYNGFLIDLKDALQAEKAISECYHNPELLNVLGNNARKTIIEKDLTWDGNAKRVFNICTHLLEKE